MNNISIIALLINLAALTVATLVYLHAEHIVTVRVREKEKENRGCCLE